MLKPPHRTKEHVEPDIGIDEPEAGGTKLPNDVSEPVSQLARLPVREYERRRHGPIVGLGGKANLAGEPVKHGVLAVDHIDGLDVVEEGPQ